MGSFFSFFEGSKMAKDKDLIIFTIYWMNGEKEYLKGWDIGDAMNRAGYNDHSIHFIFSTIAGHDESYIWHHSTKQWIKKTS